MDKWEQFRGKDFKIVSLGRPAIFFVPAKKLKRNKGVRIRQDIHLFLISQFGAYTASLIPSFVGFWKNTSQTTISDECVIYEVSFAGKEKIPLLLERLAKLASEIGEECIYLKAGQYSCLVYPNKKDRK